MAAKAKPETRATPKTRAEKPIEKPMASAKKDTAKAPLAGKAAKKK